MEKAECPYCGHEQYIDHTDGYGYEEGQVYFQRCHECDKEFAYNTIISFDYEARKCDCHNGEDHKWKLTPTFPKCLSEMECTECGERRSLTEEERQKFGVETKAEYFEKLKK